MTTTSIRGKFSKASPGGLSRRGPAHENGLARAPQCGSVRKLRPSNCTKRVAWPIQVILGLTRPARSAAPSLLMRGAANVRGAVDANKRRRTTKFHLVQPDGR